MNKNIVILGSCITRDAFNFSKDKYVINNYFARTSLISLTSKSLSIDESKINLTSSFQVKCIKQDLEKNFFLKIAENKVDYVIIDFIDERFNLLKLNESIITKSNELVASGLMGDYDFIEVERNEDLLKIWKESAKIFFDKLLELIPGNRIIIHKGLWKTKYIDENGSISEFTNQLNQIDIQNKYLNFYYEFIEENYKDINVLDMTTEDLYCSVNHIWGLSPYHFEDKYYHVFLQKLGEIIQAQSNNEFNKVFDFIKENSEVLYEKNQFIHRINNVSLHLDFEDLLIAYYVKFNNEVLFKQWYGTERVIDFIPTAKGEYEIIIFLRNPENIENVKYFQYKITI